LTILHGDIPSRPHYHQARPELLTGLRDKLLGGAGPVGVTGRAAGVGLEGMGGIGKTTLAADLCRLSEVATAFPGGVYWVTLGETPAIELAQRRLIEWLGDKAVDIRDTADGRDRLQKLLIDRQDRCLIVLDDAWELVHVRELLPTTEGSPHRQLITTRRGDLLRTLGVEERRVDELSPDAARALLAAATGFPVDRMPAEADAIARECGYLPLALAIVGGSLAGEGADIWGEVLQALRRAEHEGLLEQELPDYRRARHVFGALAVSVNRLAPEERERFLDLAVFPEDTAVPAAVFDRLWYELPVLKRKKLLTLLIDRNLARRGTDGAITLHDLQRDYLVTTVAQDLTARHRRFIDGYHRTCDGVWTGIPDDGYGFRHLPWHLREAGEIDTLRGLLFDPAWMIAKMRAVGVAALAGDYPLLPDDAEARLVGQALSLSFQALTDAPDQLAGQLWGRLAPDRGAAIAGLLESAADTAPVPWLKPRRPTLAAPGGALIRILQGHRYGVEAVAFTADGKRGLSGSNDDTLRLWDLETGTCLRVLEGHTDTVNAVAMTADGRRALSGSDDQTLWLWDLDTGTCLRALKGHSGRVTAVAITANGGRAVSGSDDQTLRLWDLETGACLRVLEGHSGTVTAVAMTADGCRAVSAEALSITLRLWDLNTGTFLRVLEGHSDTVTAVAMTADGGRALSGSDDQTLRLWDLDTGACQRVLEGHTDWVRSVAMTPDGRRALSGSVDRTLRLWDLDTGSCLRTFEGRVETVAMTPNGGRALTGARDAMVRFWDLHAGDTSMVGNDRHQGACHAVAVTADGRRVLSGCDGKILRLWDPDASDCGIVLNSFYGWFARMAITPDGQRMLNGSIDGLVWLWELGTGQSLSVFEGHTGWVLAGVMTPDGQRALTGSSDETVRLWDLDTGTCLQIFEGHTGCVRAVAVTLDGRYALSGADDGVRLWDLDTGDCRWVIEDAGEISSLAITDDGRRFLSGSLDREIRQWDLETGACLHVFEGHGGAVTSLALMPDGDRLLSASNDRTLRIWDLATGKGQIVFTADTAINCCAVAGKLVVAGDESGNVHFFDLIDLTGD
jgi:WD40 repeat protein